MPAPTRVRLHRSILALFLLLVLPLGGAERREAVVVEGVQNLYLRPDETSPVDDQAILGERLEVLEDTAGFARVRTAGGLTAWIPERALRREAAAPSRPVRVVSPAAHLYATPSFTAARPLLTAPLGSVLDATAEAPSEGHAFLEVRLPDGRRAFVARQDTEPGAEPAERLDPASWIALGRRFLGAPYTWGGTTPAGFDCSGLVYRLLASHGVRVRRNSYEQCFREPRLVPVRFADLLPGDLLFFGSEDRIDHEALWIGDGRVLQASSWGTPSTQVTVFAESPRLKERFRYARRLLGLPGAARPRFDEEKRAALERRLRELTARDGAGGGASYGVAFKELESGRAIALGERSVMHAASTMKTPILLELLRRADAGELKLSDELAVRNEFRSIVDGSPFKLELEADTDFVVAEKLGKTATLELLAREMIARSSNLATNLLLTLVTPEAVQRFTEELGAPSVKVRRCVEDGKAFEKGLNNETDAAGMAVVMEACVRSPRLSAAARAKAWELLTAQVWNEQIPAGIPAQAGAAVAHKTGWISSVQHDCGIVRLPDGREYVLVLLANDFGASDAGRKRVLDVTRRVSRTVWEAMIAP